ncbi:putative ABC exporter domain-containing protein [Gorillibacterium massiliense]|uniref:putative ABC exporter domain-containing protein n=1 Tax=Gorillibacterium massiliense TaxID=1280390 RepID=UPI0004BC9636|nr:putative ABC exporter domain-containing protein [Gorillibacterium massiliense]
MKPLFYLLRRTFTNHVRQVLRKPGLLISYLAIVVFMGLLLLSSGLSSNRPKTASPDTYGSIISIVILIFVYMTIRSGIKKGSSFFRMADVNLVFTAPISPKRVLIYGFIKQVTLTLLTVFFFIFQIPNLLNNYNVNAGGVLVLLAALYLLLLMLQLLSMLIYSWTSSSRKARKMTERIWNLLGLAIAAALVGKLVVTGDIRKTANDLLNSSAFEHVPVVGWFKTVLMAPVIGYSSSFALACGLIAAGFLLVILGFVFMRTDFYEDVLGQTETMETMRAMKKAGKVQVDRSFGLKLRKAEQRYLGTGAKAIYYRHMLEYKKSGFFFIGRSSLFLAAVGFASRYVIKPDQIIYMLMAAAYYLLIIGQFTGKWVAEMERPYIFLLPASSGAKLFHATRAETVKHLCDGIVLFGVAAASLQGNPLVALLCAVGYTSYGVLLTYSDVLYRRLFGPLHSKVFQMFMGMLMIVLVLFPGTIIALVAKFAIHGGAGAGNIIFCLVLIGFNLLVASAIFAGSKGIFDKLESN